MLFLLPRQVSDGMHLCAGLCEVYILLRCLSFSLLPVTKCANKLEDQSENITFCSIIDWIISAFCYICLIRWQNDDLSTHVQGWVCHWQGGGEAMAPGFLCTLSCSPLAEVIVCFGHSNRIPKNGYFCKVKRCIVGTLLSTEVHLTHDFASLRMSFWWVIDFWRGPCSVPTHGRKGSTSQ